MCLVSAEHVYLIDSWHSLLGFDGDQQPQRASYAEGLVDHCLHLGEGPEEQQVLVDGVDLPAHLQAGHLEGQMDRQETEGSYLLLAAFLFVFQSVVQKRYR